MTKPVLYSTEGCHLCEKALAMLTSLRVEVNVQDIAFDEQLFSRYGVTIPVLRYDENELFWPFDNEILIIWLKENGITYHT